MSTKNINNFMIKTHITENCKNYRPKNKKKYKGQYPIICRSGWEYKFCQWCDANSNIIYWASEPLPINYIHPLEQRDARYYPDFLLKVNNSQNKTDTWLIEVKPFKETQPPLKGKKKKSTVLYEQKTWIINQAKWKSALKYCKLKGWKFKIITEKELFN